MKMPKSKRARGTNRGGTGGGWEATNPDYQDLRLQRLKQDYLSLHPAWQPTFLSGLSAFERDFCVKPTA